MLRAASFRPLVIVLAACMCALPVAAIPNYSIVTITELPFETYAWAVNSQGTVGGLTTSNGGYVGYVRSPGGTFDQFNLISMIRGINNLDHVVGHNLIIDLATGDQQVMPPVSDYYLFPWALDINESDVVVGYAAWRNNEEGLNQTAFVWDPVNGTRATSVPALTELVSINNSNIAVGNIRASTGSSSAAVYDVATDTAINLDDILVPSGPRWSSAAYINNGGVVTGEGWNGTFTAAFIWSQAGGFTFLPALKGGETGRVHPTGISDDGLVVGYALTGDWEWRAFVWSETDGMHDLNDLVAGIEPIILDRALRISDNGIIVGDAHTGPNLGPYRPFILTPQDETLTGIGKTTTPAPASLHAFPNPFNPRTTLRYALPVAGKVRIDVYSVRGVHVATLFEGSVSSGSHDVAWDGHDGAGRAVGSGVYLVRLETQAGVVSHKVTLLK